MWGWSSVPLLPVLVPQALWVALRASRLPEAAGPRAGIVGQGPDLRLLILGDSSAAGVGAATQGEALAGHLVARLAQSWRVEWRVEAVSGATTVSVLKGFVAHPADAVVVSLGVNDVKNGVSARAWEARNTRLLARLRAECGARVVAVAGVPPLGDFPVLPQPLRRVLGARAVRFDGLLQRVCAAQGAVHVGFDFPMDVADMAPDGFHAGPRIYAAWASHVVNALERGLKSA